MNWLETFIRATAWQMEKPPAYGAFHLIFTFVGISICILLSYFLRKSGKKANRAILVGVSLFLIITEVYKQLFYFYHIGNGNYQWWIFPFQLCSVPMYLCMIAPFLKEGRVQKGMYNFMTTYNLLGGFMAFIEPSGIVHEYWTLTLHAFCWHMMLIFVGFYLIASGRCARTGKDFLHAIFTFLGLCCVAFCINLIFRKAANGDINMFYVGPSNSPLAVFKTISEKLGWFVNTLLYIPTVTLGAHIVFLPVHIYSKKKGLIGKVKEESKSTVSV